VSDVLIVGAGSAGSVLAERLSADPGCSVTVLESGPGLSDPVSAALTADAFQLPIGPDSPVARHYRTLLTDRPPRPAEIVRGECVGGSGAVNGGYFWRAARGDHGWAPGWSWEETEDHYRAVESRIAPHRAVIAGGPTEAFAAAAGVAGHADAVAAVPLNIDRGTRRGPGAVFLGPSLGRPNITVRSGIRAHRVRVRAGRAVGVEASGPGGPVVLDADRVVLSAGAIGSAVLLLRSGIGPAADLRRLAIPVRAELPVGQAFSDHPEWLMSTAWSAVGGRPVLEAVLVADGLEVRPYTHGFGSPTTSVGVALMRPRSRGRLSLPSEDPGVPPRIEHRYDSEPADVADLARGAELVREILSGATELGGPRWSTSQHLCGTAPIGANGDPHAVVDHRCRVHGVEGLWVIDGSVLPRVPGRGPHATIAMLAHRAAEFV